MKKLLLGLGLVIGLMSFGNAVNVGDQVYVIFGEKSSAEVNAGTIVQTGESRSKVSWDYCTDCSLWIYNSSFYYDRATPDKIVADMDSSHTSFGEGVGVAAGLGALWLFWKANQ